MIDCVLLFLSFINFSKQPVLAQAAEIVLKSLLPLFLSLPLISCKMSLCDQYLQKTEKLLFYIS